MQQVLMAVHLLALLQCSAAVLHLVLLLTVSCRGGHL
jgi:hypothetical protein